MFEWCSTEKTDCSVRQFEVGVNNLALNLNSESVIQVIVGKWVELSPALTTLALYFANQIHILKVVRFVCSGGCG